MNAVIDRTGCTADRHGDYVSFSKYGCRCADGREEYRLYRKRGREGRREPRRIPATGTTRRVQALIAMGHSQETLAYHLGWTRKQVNDHAYGRRQSVFTSTAKQIADLYTALANEPGTSKYARTVARRNGWLTCAAWEDIDTDTEPIQAGPSRIDSRNDVDPVKVDRACRGQIKTGALTIAEREAVIDRLDAAGWSARQIEDCTGITGRTVVRRRAANRGQVAA